jgi:mono/diheme cytochrome c family protein
VEVRGPQHDVHHRLIAVRLGRASFGLLLLLFVASCRRHVAPADACFSEPTDVAALAGRFAKDASFRRSCLVRSLTTPENSYARDRLEHDTEQDWGRLPIAAFATRPVLPSDLGRPAPLPDESWKAVPVGSFPDTPDGLRQRGEQMFMRFPAQIEVSMLRLLRSADGPARYGLWQTRESVGGLVWVALPGGVFPSLTCSSCHASVDQNGRLRVGVPNHRFDIGKAKDDYLGVRTLYSTWGPGREDIAADDKDNPVVMADLRAVRYQTALHRTANLRNSLVALAIRVETGLITAHRRVARPDRRDAFSLAYFLWTLGDALDTRTALQHPGRAVFERHCGPCHRGAALAGQPIAAESIQSPVASMPTTARGTGKLRVPALLGVADRDRLLYGGEADGIDGLLDSARTNGGHTVGAVLDASERQAIAAYLRAL